MLQRLPRILAQVKVGITLDNLLSKSNQIFYSLHQANEITKKCLTVEWIQYRYNTKLILDLWIQKIVKFLIHIG